MKSWPLHFVLRSCFFLVWVQMGIHPCCYVCPKLEKAWVFSYIWDSSLRILKFVFNISIYLINASFARILLSTNQRSKYGEQNAFRRLMRLIYIYQRLHYRVPNSKWKSLLRIGYRISRILYEHASPLCFPTICSIDRRLKYSSKSLPRGILVE